MARKRIGDILFETGVITSAQLQDALHIQRETKLRLGEVLVDKGFVTQQQIIEVLEFQLGIPHVNLYRFEIDRNIVQLIPEALARRHTLFAVRRDKDKLLVAMADPLDFYAIDDVEMSTGFTIEPAIAARDELRKYIDRYYSIQESVDELRALVSEDDELATQVTDEESPVVRLVNQMIHQAVLQRASDIHIDPGEDSLSIRYRVDGILRTEQTLPKAMHGILTARVKIMSDLNIAERRLPQDGRMQIDVDYRKVDIRVSTLPTVLGEKCVLRLLDAQNAVLDLNGLGMSAGNLDVFHKMITGSQGMVLITGPTGSGKTSTLYAALQSLASDEQNIITVEDPVEYQLAGVNQVQVNQHTGLTFARGLRSILRQDPDIVMVGEIRDGETAEIAVRAALTGHLVLSTLHTNDAMSSIIRLLDMGVEPFLVASSLTGIVAQRLVRRVCEHCATPYEATEAEKRYLSGHGYVVDKLLRGEGCGHCGRTGFRGRLAIQEVVRVDDRIRAMIVGKRPDVDYRRYVADQGQKSILADGITKALQGLTTLSEVLRVTMQDEG